MNLFGIGPLELGLILLLALIIFGPKDIEKASKAVGKVLNKLIHSESWRTVQKTSQELKNLPNRLIREYGLDELEKTTKGELEKADSELKQSILSEKDK
ncbi:MAG: twin-arginine translocase TatA/TatE family subunit [Anaerolineales bacterium]